LIIAWEQFILQKKELCFMNIVYFVIGNNVVIHMQVEFSIRTILSQISDDDTIYVVTDTPTMYCYLPHVIIIPISNERIKEWRGKHDFFWRVKIKVLQHIAQISPNKAIMYLDGDTYLHGSLTEIKALLSNNYGMMHLDEGCPSEMKERSLSMWQTVNGKTYAGVTISTRHHMWNAGVVAIPVSIVGKVTDMALAVCDSMLDDGSEPVTVEQYALSIALFECANHLVAANKWIGHYWHYKYHWSSYIANFFVLSYRKSFSLEKQIDLIRKKNLKRVHRWILIKRTFAKLTGQIY
jgi:hypothetical protein